MSNSLLEKQKDLIELVKQGKFVEGMEEYYADDAVNVESNGSFIEGKDAIIANEKEILSKVAAFHGIDVKSTGVGEDDGAGNGVTFAEYAMNVDLKDGSTFSPEQVQVTRWENGKAKRITFYYDPAKA